jgi:hypothetical protein
MAFIRSWGAASRFRAKDAAPASVPICRSVAQRMLLRLLPSRSPVRVDRMPLRQLVHLRLLAQHLKIFAFIAAHIVGLVLVIPLRSS